MTGTEVFIGLGAGIALIAGAIVVSLVPWRLPWPRRHDIRGNGDYAEPTDMQSRRSFDADGGGDGGD